MTNGRKAESLLRSGWLKQAESCLLWLSLFLLSWRMRYQLHGGEVLGVYVEYSSWHIYLTDLVVVALLLLWALRKKGSPTFPPEVLHWPLLAFLVWMSFSVLWAEDKVTALMVAGRWWLFWGWFIYLINEVKGLGQMIWPVALGVLFQSGIGLAQYIANSSLGLQFWGEPILVPSQSGVPVVELDGLRHIRANGLLPHANILGGVLAVTLPFLIYGWTQMKQSLARNWLIVVIGLASVALALSFSRAAWVGMGAAVLLLIWQLGWKKYWPVWAASLGMFLVTLLSQYQAFWARVSGSGSLEARSIMERWDGFNYWRLVMDDVALWGTGAGNYIQKLVALEPGQSGWWYQPVHNIYLLWSGELGLVGLALIIWLGIGIVVLGRSQKVVVGAWLMPIFVWLVIGLFDHWPISLQQGRILIFWSLAVLVLGYRSHLKAKKV